MNYFNIYTSVVKVTNPNHTLLFGDYFVGGQHQLWGNI